jgi:hypothetical protein
METAVKVNDFLRFGLEPLTAANTGPTEEAANAPTSLLHSTTAECILSNLS